MLKRLRFLFLMAVLGLAWAVATPVGAALQAVGPVTGPHGFPLYYTDTNNLSLELCLDADWCFFDPVDPNNPNHVELGVGGEVFWWLAEATTATPTGRALLVMGMEGTFGGTEEVVNGGQISFGRLRVRVDVPVAGTYTVTHPFGTLTFENVTVADGINYTADIGAANFLNVEAGFAGALMSDIGPFLTFPDYQNNPALQVAVLDEQDQPTGEIIQYVGTLDPPSQVVGSQISSSHSSGFQNFFRVEGPTGVIADTDLFGVMGRVYAGREPLPHEYPTDQFEQRLVDVGPINRATDFGNNGTAFPGGFTGNETADGYPFGYPIWYEDVTGLQLTICQGGNPMCISDPVNLNDPAQALLMTGGETFYWSADASIDLGEVGGRTFTADLILGLEGTFGGAEALEDGNQITFGRTRIRIDTPVAGDYTVIYPYGVKEFTNVPQGRRAINFTADIGIADPSDPDYAFVGAMYSEIGPNYLVWPDFDNREEAFLSENPQYANLVQPLDINEPAGAQVQYVGDPAILHEVTGAIFEYDGEVVNYFRVIGPGNLDVRTNLFAISGKVFDPETFRAPIANVLAPVAVNDTAETPFETAVDINVLANDTIEGVLIPAIDPPAAVTVVVPPDPGEVIGPFNGTAVVNGDNSVTYTPNAGFSGVDSFSYTVTDNATTLISNAATVTVTVLAPPLVEEALVTRARLELRRLRWDIRGTSNLDGSQLTVRQGSATGSVIGTATVNNGRWSLRTTSTTAPAAGQVQIFVVSDSGADFGPFNVQVR